MHVIKRWSIAAVFGTVFVGFALAQVAKQQAAPFRELFLDLDTNHDNAIEREEVPASARPAFERLLKSGDDNHNGKLEAEEYKAVLLDLREFTEQAKKKAVERFKSMDKDGDGKVSREEFTGPKERFDVLDRNADGLLTQEEFLSNAQAKAAGKAQQKKKAANAKKAADARKGDDAKKAEDAKKPDDIKKGE
jgi:Ca2+-binding EF-hand superfamily protein